MSEAAEKSGRRPFGRRPPPTGSAHQGVFAVVRAIAPRFALLIALVGLIGVFCAARPSSFATWANAQNIITDAAPLLVIAVALTIPLVAGEFDLSIGAVMGLAGALAIVLMSMHGFGWVAAIVAALALGAGIGLVNGFLVAFAGGSSFVITLAAGTVCGGIEILLTKSQTLFEGISPGYTNLATAKPLLGLPWTVWIAFAVALVTWTMLEQTELGRYMYAVGGNSEAARLAGVRTRHLRALSFVLVGTGAAGAGILLTSSTASSTPAQGLVYLLPAFAAVFLGSAVFRLGLFNVAGTVVGVFFLKVVEAGLLQLNISSAWVNIVQGGILIGAILLSRTGEKVT